MPQAPSIASRKAVARGVSSTPAVLAKGSSARSRAEISSFSTVWTARRLAVSPPAWPPIPSHTMKRPSSSLTRKLSSLCSRFIPTSVRAALRKRIKAGSPRGHGSLHERRGRAARRLRSACLPRAALLRTLGLLQQLARVLQRDLRGLAPEQPRELRHPL